MDIWQRLGIKETDDLAAIKRAYHIKLRDCHPEDDPEGFRLLREAYEAASRPRPTISDPPESPVAPVRLAEAPELTDLLVLLGDAKRRFVSSEWDAWQASLQSLSLVQQSQLSDEVLQRIFEWQWLPSPLIERLWQSLDWAALLRRTGDIQKKGEFLDWWRQAPLPAPLEWLATLDHARQRAVMAFYQPLLLSLEAGDRNSVLGLIYHYAMPIFSDHPALMRLQLQALRAIGDDSDVTHRLSLTLTLLEQEQLSEDDWDLLSDSTLRCGKEQLVMQVAEALEDREHEALLANHLIHWYINSDQELARWLQALSRACHWPTVRSAFWEPQWLMLPWQQSDPLEEWLHDQMLDFGEAPLTALAFESMPNIRGALARLWWSSEFGTWQSLEAALAQPELANAESGWQFLARLLQRHARRKLAKRPELPLLDPLLNKYGSDDWLSIAPPDAAQIACATPEQWVTCLRRYPLMPDEWFNAIVQRANEEGWQDEIVKGLHLGARLSHQRIYSKTRLGDAWRGEGWAGCFRWAQFYYAYAWTPKHHLNAMRHAMGVLPPSQDDTPLATVLRLSAQPTVYQAAITTACARWPEQYILSLEIGNQTALLRNSAVSDQSLLERAKESELTALAALIGRRLDNEPDLASTIVLWNLLLCHKESNNAYYCLLTPLRERLEALRSAQGFDFDSYPYTEESLIYAYLWQNREHLSTQDVLEHHIPSAASAKFVYPVCYGLGMLAHDFSEQGFQARLLDPIYKQQADLTPSQQEAVSLLLVYLEDKLNDQLEHDRNHAKKRFRLQSGAQLMFVSVLTAILPYFVFPLEPSLREVLASGSPYWVEYYSLGLDMAGMLFLNLYLMWHICRAQTRPRTSRSYLIWSLIWMAITFYINSAWLAVPLWLGHIFMSIRLRPGALRRGWPKAFYKQGRMPLGDILD
jgi:hypothetical protein